MDLNLIYYKALKINQNAYRTFNNEGPLIAHICLFSWWMEW